MALKTMPIAKLQALKSQIEAVITEKVRSRRRELETGNCSPPCGAVTQHCGIERVGAV